MFGPEFLCASVLYTKYFKESDSLENPLSNTPINRLLFSSKSSAIYKRQFLIIIVGLSSISPFSKKAQNADSQNDRLL